MSCCHGAMFGATVTCDVLRSRSCPSLLVTVLFSSLVLFTCYKMVFQKRLVAGPRRQLCSFSRCCFRRRAPLSPQPRARERSAAARCSQNVTAGSPHPSPRRTLSLSSRPCSLAPSPPRPLAPTPPRPNAPVSTGGGYSRGLAADHPPSMRSPHSPAANVHGPETVAGRRRGP